MKWLWILALQFAVTASAADISGTWKGSAETPNGTIERTFVFKQDGTTLTGETSSNNFGKSAIEDGKVEGDNVSFTISVNMQGNEAKVSYKGKAEGDQIKFTVGVAGYSQTIELTAKRVPG